MIIEHNPNNGRNYTEMYEIPNLLGVEKILLNWTFMGPYTALTIVNYQQYNNTHSSTQYNNCSTGATRCIIGETQYMLDLIGQDWRERTTI